MRLALALVLAFLLAGCGGNEIVRGRLTLDLRPEGQRTLVYWPPEHDMPRYRYVGELVGEPNFVDVGEKSLNPVMGALKWLAGIGEDNRQLLLQRPHGGTVDEKGRIYVVDAGRSAVLVFDPLAPVEEKSDRGEGQLLAWEFLDPRTRFQMPVAVAKVWGGDLAVSDSKLAAVARLNPKGEPVAQIYGEELLRPTGLAYDSGRGLLYVADTEANDIKVYDGSLKRVKTIGSPGQGPGEFNAPTHLAFVEDRLYVSDTLNNRIQIFDADGRYVRHFGEQGLFVGNFTRPKGVAASDGVIYAVESYYRHLLAYNENGELLMSISGSGLKEGEFKLPSGVWTDSGGRVYLADMFNGRVVVFQFLGHSTK